MNRLQIRLMDTRDLDFADSVRAAANWNQTKQDWERFVACEPRGCFVAEWEGSPAGTATTTYYGPELGWIGMLLVHPEFRKRGIGTGLLRHCIASLTQREAKGIKLDATPIGQRLYERLGFTAEERVAPLGNQGGPDPECGPWRSPLPRGRFRPDCSSGSGRLRHQPGSHPAVFSDDLPSSCGRRWS